MSKIREILETAHEIGKNGYPLNTDLLEAKINQEINKAVVEKLDELIDKMGQAEHENSEYVEKIKGSFYDGWSAGVTYHRRLAVEARTKVQKGSSL